MPDSPKGEYPFRLAAARQATFPKGTAFRGGGKLSRHAKGPISEDDFPRLGEDVAKRQKGESVERSETGGVSTGVVSEVRVSA